MKDLRERLVKAITNCKNEAVMCDLDVDDMAEYLIEAISELHLYERYKEGIYKEMDSVLVKDKYSKGLSNGLRKSLILKIIFINPISIKF